MELSTANRQLVVPIVFGFANRALWLSTLSHIALSKRETYQIGPAFNLQRKATRYIGPQHIITFTSNVLSRLPSN